MIDIRKYMLIPFEDKGRSFEGVDCWGLIYLIYKEELGITLPTYTDGYKKACAIEVQKIIDNNKGNWKQVEQKDVEQFDLVLMRSILTVEGKAVIAETHIAVMVDKHSFIHTEENIGVSLVNLKKDKRVVNRIVGFFRYEKE